MSPARGAIEIFAPVERRVAILVTSRVSMPVTVLPRPKLRWGSAPSMAREPVSKGDLPERAMEPWPPRMVAPVTVTSPPPARMREPLPFVPMRRFFELVQVEPVPEMEAVPMEPALRPI